MTDLTLKKVEKVLQKSNIDINKRVDRFTSKMYRNFIETKQGDIKVKENLVNPKNKEDLEIIIEILLFINQNPQSKSTHYLITLSGFYDMLLNIENL